jgi:hypothetical protein
MEEKTVTGLSELACRALFARTWLGSAGVAATYMDLAEFDIDLEREYIPTEYDPLLYKSIGWTTAVAGKWAGENSYVMEVSEWLDDYWHIVSHQGLVCKIPEMSETEVHENRLVVPADKTTSPSASPESPQMVLPPRIGHRRIVLSQSLYNFCLRYNIQNYLQLAINLAKRCFPSLHELQLYLEHDPDTGEQWLVIDATVEGEVDEILSKYDKYTDLWISSVPWPDRSKIVLVYDII